ncbi:hypothetical protein D3C78_1216350 [compost metagenome]
MPGTVLGSKLNKSIVRCPSVCERCIIMANHVPNTTAIVEAASDNQMLVINAFMLGVPHVSSCL